LCDGDRIRLSWEEGYKEKYFFTDKGKKLSSLKDYCVIEYLNDWDSLLVSNNITLIYGELSSKYVVGYDRKRLFFVEASYRDIVAERNKMKRKI